jgi:acyl-CoA synthetase (AMP-forming)/AMP-acid ligase II
MTDGRVIIVPNHVSFLDAPLVAAFLPGWPGLQVRGPNVMAGYLRGGDVEVPPDGWYDTGDIVTVDAEGFVTIVGRVKRFAKLGGEMISLAAAERIAETAVPEIRHAVVALPDPRRGEKLIAALALLARRSVRWRIRERSDGRDPVCCSTGGPCSTAHVLCR